MSTSRTSSLKSLYRVSGKLTELLPSMSIQTLRVFLAVAMREGLSVMELRDRLDTPYSSMSRYLIELSVKSRRKSGDGLGLLETRNDPEDLRIKRYYLSPLGRKVVQEISIELHKGK